MRIMIVRRAGEKVDCRGSNGKYVCFPPNWGKPRLGEFPIGNSPRPLPIGWKNVLRSAAIGWKENEADMYASTFCAPAK